MELDVAVDPVPADAPATGGPGPTVRALAHPPLVGDPQVGDRVLLNTTALDRGLGTGGYALVVALPDRLPPDPGGPGHLVKGRYTPWQALVLGVDDPESPHHATLARADDLAGLPVVVADLHSAVPAVVAGVRATWPDARVVYVMTDGGALPAWFSRTVDGLRQADWLRATVSVGQAFGGDLDAVTVHSGLLAARAVLGADVVVVAQGPGNLGTGTPFGFSGVAVADALHAAAALGGRPVAALRVSASDARPRHRGVSHHSTTVLERLTFTRTDVVVPQLDGPLGEDVRRQTAGLGARHTLVEEPLEGLLEVLARCPVPLSSMGRGLDVDPTPFLAAAAAGRHAARLAAASPGPRPSVPSGAPA